MCWEQLTHATLVLGVCRRARTYRGWAEELVCIAEGLVKVLLLQQQCPLLSVMHS